MIFWGSQALWSLKFCHGQSVIDTWHSLYKSWKKSILQTKNPIIWWVITILIIPNFQNATMTVSLPSLKSYQIQSVETYLTSHGWRRYQLRIIPVMSRGMSRGMGRSIKWSCGQHQIRHVWTPVWTVLRMKYTIISKEAHIFLRMVESPYLPLWRFGDRGRLFEARAV